jgi:GNAT superfamily N-acetyltransferase
MKVEDCHGGMKLSVAEGWNQTEKDWKFLIEDPKNVCMIAAYDQQIIGTTTAINYSDKTAWIGMVLVDKEFRGLGVSKALLSRVFDELKTSTSIKLDATIKGLPVYKKFDFNSEYSILRLLSSSNNLHKNLSKETNLIKSIQQDYLEEIISLDEQVFGANRSKLIRYLFREFPNKAWWFKNKNH